ncbi:MAG: glycosyltransferase [Pseudomonadota bacterium]
MITVLLAPAHFYLNDIYGSEEMIPLHFMKNAVLKNGVEFEAIANKLSLDKKIDRVNISVIGKKTEKFGLFKKGIFVFDVFLKSRKILQKRNIHIIHHMFPFGVFHTFNLLFLFNRFKRKQYKYIIGPLMVPPSFLAADDLSIPEYHQQGINNKIFLILSEACLKLLQPILRYLSLKTLENADVLVAISHQAARFYADLFPQKEVVTIHMGVDTKQFSYMYRKPKKIIEVLVLNRLVKRKGTDDVIRAMAEVIRNNHNVRLRIVGDGPELNNLKKMAKDFEIVNQVVFEGYTPYSNILKFYEAADIYCIMTKDTIFCNTAFEAMSTGLPVIFTDSDGARESIEDRKSGFLVPMGDYQKCAQVISELAESRELRLKIGETARSVMEEKFDWNKLACSYTEIYEKLLSNE